MLGLTLRKMARVPSSFSQYYEQASKFVSTTFRKQSPLNAETEKKPFEKFLNKMKEEQKQKLITPNLKEQKLVVPKSNPQQQKLGTFNLHKLSNPNVKTTVPIMAAHIDVMKTVKPHVQSIKFPSRRAQDLKPPAAQHFGVSNTVESLLTKPSQPASATGNKGPAIESSQLPLKYRRKPLSPEEMECIEKGGQV